MNLTAEERRLLRAVALEAVEFGLAHGAPITVDIAAYPERLRVEEATFVTLRHAGELVGCIGTLTPHRPLVADVAHNAHCAAFGDPRFPPLAAEKLAGLDLHISLLSPLERVVVGSESDLLSQLRPGVDGLVIREGALGATFLPAMWPQLGDPRTFLRRLKEKARLPADYWSPTIEVFRYTAEEV